MTAVSGFANLANGDRLNLSSLIKVLPVIPLPKSSKKSSSSASGSGINLTEKLAKYREHYKTAHREVPSTVVHERKSLLEEKRTPFKIPNSYIDYTGPDDSDDVVEYDVDEEDCEWLHVANEARRSKKIVEISTEKFEIAIDRMEKCCKFEAQGGSGGSVSAGAAAAQANGEDADDVCCVCADGDVSNANQIIYCDMCNIAVHQDCYGVPYIPEGSWLCRRCKLSPSQAVSCCLCPYRYGAFKPTSDGRWAHVVCAIWLNEVHFGNAVFLEPIEGVNESLKIRSKLRCLYCRKKQGACLQCSSRSCVKSFHVTCAQQLGLVMKVQTDQSPSNDEDVNVKRYVYCQQHATGNSLSKKEIELSIRKARRNMEASTGYRPTINMPSLTRVSMDEIAEATGIEDFDELVVYWYQKRRSRAGVPLIRRLNPEIVQKEKRGNVDVEDMPDEDQKVLRDFQCIRHSLETTRLLSEQVKKRELNKRNHIRQSLEVVERCLIPVGVIILDTIDLMASKDSKEVFAEPVRIDGYSAIVKNPMDISTMRKKAESFKYASINDLRKDLLLMAENCSKFNHDNEYYYKYGKRFRKSAMGVLEEADMKVKELETIGKMDSKYWTLISKELCEGAVYGREKSERDELRNNGEMIKEDEKPTTSNARTTSESSRHDRKSMKNEKRDGKLDKKDRVEKDEIEEKNVELDHPSTSKENEPAGSKKRGEAEESTSTSSRNTTHENNSLKSSRSGRGRRGAPSSNSVLDDAPSLTEGSSTTLEVQEDEPMEEDDDGKEESSRKDRSPATNSAKSSSAWKNLFSGANTPSSNKRKPVLAPGSAAKRGKKEAVKEKEPEKEEKKPSILPFLSLSTSSSLRTMSFSELVQQQLSLKPLAPPLIADAPSSIASFRNTRGTGTRTSNGATYNSYRDVSIKSPLPADTASSTEYSTDEDVVVDVKTPPSASRRKMNESVSSSKSTDKRRSTLSKPVLQQVTSVEKARQESKSKFAHNAIVSVDGKAAKVIDMQYAHLSDISREQRHQMISSRQNAAKALTPRRGNSANNGDDGDDKRLVYVEFFQKTNSGDQYKWVSSDRVHLIDLSNSTKLKIGGLKAAKEWQQAIMNK